MTTSKVTEVIGNDISKLMAPGTEKRQGMRGFDADYVDIVDYIVRCTHKIWEEKQVGLIYTHYGHNALVHGTRGDSYGIESVVAGTVQTLAMFPDRRLFADDVIWSGDDEAGYYTSHRITSTAHHSGFGVYGAPTGRKLRYRVIADCVVRENRIVEEWLVRDELSIARQLGLDEAELVKAIAEGWAALDEGRAGGRRPGRGRTEQGPVAAGAAAALGRRRLRHRGLRPPRLARHLEPPDVQRDLPALRGRPSSVTPPRAASCTATTTPCSSCWTGRPRSPMRGCTSITSPCKGTRRPATAWRCAGPCSARTRATASTARRRASASRILGISQQHVRDGHFVAEWTVFDELALMAQIYQL